MSFLQLMQGQTRLPQAAPHWTPGSLMKRLKIWLVSRNRLYFLGTFIWFFLWNNHLHCWVMCMLLLWVRSYSLLSVIFIKSFLFLFGNISYPIFVRFEEMMTKISKSEKLWKLLPLYKTSFLWGCEETENNLVSHSSWRTIADLPISSEASSSFCHLYLMDTSLIGYPLSPVLICNLFLRTPSPLCFLATRQFELFGPSLVELKINIFFWVLSYLPKFLSYHLGNLFISFLTNWLGVGYVGWAISLQNSD